MLLDERIRMWAELVKKFELRMLQDKTTPADLAPPDRAMFKIAQRFLAEAVLEKIKGES